MLVSSRTPAAPTRQAAAPVAPAWPVAPAAPVAPARPVAAAAPARSRARPSQPTKRRSETVEALITLVSAWNPPARVIWYLLRPLATLAAMAGCLLWRSDIRPLVAFAAAGAVLLVRPVRRWWAGLALALLCGPVSIVAGVAVTTRTLLTVLALRINGPGGAAGLDRLVASRRRALGPLDDSPPLDLSRAWSKVREAVDGPPELELTDPLVELLAAAWCEADARKLAKTAWEAAVGLLLGRWPFGRKPSAEGLFLQMMFRESVIDWSVGTIAAGLSAGIALMIRPQGLVHLAGFDLTRWIGILAGGLVGLQWSRLRLGTENRAIRVSRTWLVISSLALLMLRTPGILILLSSTVIGLVLANLNRGASRLHLTPRITAPRLPMSLRWRRGHGAWRAARTAKTAGRLEVAQGL